MECDELLLAIRRVPTLCVHDKKSLRELWAFLAGWEAGINSAGGKSNIFGSLRSFNIWVAKELGFAEPTSGWCNMITDKAGSDEKAFDLFFELLDKYKMNQRLR
jgi:hypothetical protein